MLTYVDLDLAAKVNCRN